MNRLLQAVLLTALSLATGASLAQGYPAKPVRAIVPFGAGGQSDVVARVVAQKLSERWQQPVVIENRVGANGNLGTEAAARAAPDGYTLFFPTQTVAVNALLAPIAGVDPLKDLAPISLTALVELVLVVHPQIPASNLPEFIAYAKANPGKLNYGITSLGTSGQLGIEQLKTLAGIDVQMIPYTAISNLISDLVSGRISVYLTPPASVISHIQAGRLRPIGVTGDKRFALLPNVAPIRETYPSFAASTWFGVFAPARTPPEIISKVNADLRQVLDDPEVKQRLAGSGVETLSSTPEQLRNTMLHDMKLVESLIKSGAIKAP